MKVSHIACPECRKNGNDQSGDNLAVYPDGGKFCFACGYFETSTSKYQHHVEEADRVTYMVGHMPDNLRSYLRQFLTDTEIDTHFLYDSTRDRAVLKDLLPNFYWGRGIRHEMKVYTKGEVPFHVFGNNTEDLVIVEDPISAIVVSRVTNCVALYGSYLRPAWYKFLTHCPSNRVVFWLDFDKQKESLQLALTFKHLFNTDYVVSSLDPKYYKEEDVKKYLSKGIDKT